MKRARKQREVFDISTAPEWLSDESKVEWTKLPEETRQVILRRTAEQERGLAICKDRRFGKPKNCLDGFYGLEVAKQKLRSMERKLPADSAELVAERERVTAWGVELDRWFTAMSGFEAMAAERGMTFLQLLEYFHEIERRLLADPIEGLRFVWSIYGDGRPFEEFVKNELLPAMYAEQAKNPPQVPHVH
jgi:hypothetical protein